jgi:hypothetical protein
VGKVVTAVRKADSPQTALLAIAAGIDLILEKLEEPHRAAAAVDPWGAEQWSPAIDETGDALAFTESYEHPPEEHVPAIQVEGNVRGEGPREVVMKGVPEEKQIARRLFAERVLKLDKTLQSGGHGSPEGFESWNDVYAKAGPMWLYIGNRELFMTYPRQVRSMMVADVEADDPEEAHKMGRDVLKFEGESGPGSTAMMNGDVNIG